jgi:hypothetical protein
VRRRILITLLFFAIIVIVNQPFLRAAASKNVLIIDLPRLSLSEINSSYPNLRKLIENGSVAIMTTPLAEPVALDQVYFSFNSGTQIKSAEDNYLLFDSGEEYKGVPAGKLYQSLMGYKIPTAGIVHLGLAKVIQLNSNEITPNIGLFGELLHQKSIKTAAIGNADADLINRCGSLLLMDQKGSIDFGAIGDESLRIDSQFPFGLRTDNDQVFSTWQDFRKKAQVIVVTLGDLERLERFSLYLTNRQWSLYRRQVLQNYDHLLGRFLSEIDFHSTLTLVFTAQPTLRNAGIGERLSPVIIRGPGFGAGLLYSGSTRKPGIITCYDLPITILDFLNIPKSRFFSGHVLKQISGNWQQIAHEQSQLVQNYSVRWPLLTVYGYLLIGLILTGVIGAVFWSRHYQFFQWIGYVYLLLLTVPVVFLIEAAINPLDWFTIIGWTLGLGGFIWLVTLYLARGDHLRTLSIISIITVGVIIFEGFFNGFLELKSFFGYSAVAGARFYGIGNEYMGFLLGAYIVAVSLNLTKITRYKTQLLWFITCFLAIFLAHPNLGSSIGGGTTALIGLGITTYLWLERPIRVREIAGLIAALIILLIGVGLWDYYINSNNMTHFGQFLAIIKSQGFDTMTGLIKRKLELNIRLIASTPWTKVLLAILVAIPLLYKRPPALVARFIQKYPNQTRGFFGLTLTAIVALLVNDSGIVTVTTMFMFGIPLLLLVVLKEWAAKRS